MTSNTAQSRNFESLEAWLSNSTPKHTRFPAHGCSVVTNLVLDVSHDRIVSASDDHSIHIYTLSTGQLERKLEGHQGGVWSIALASSTGGDSDSVGKVDLVLSGSTDRTLRVWDMNDGRCVHVFGGHTSTVRALEVVNPEWLEVPDGNGGVKKEFWPSRPFIVSGSRDSSVKVWALPRKGQPEYKVGEEVLEDSSAKINVAENPYHLHHLQGHTDAVRAVTARGRMAVSGSYDNTVRVWDIVSGELKHTLEGHTSKVYSVTYDPSRAQAYSGSLDCTVRIWCTMSGACLDVLEGHSSLVGLITLSPSYLVTGSADSTLRVWDASSGTLLHVLSEHTGAITCFYHDETKIISGSDGALKLWDIKDGSLVKNMVEGVTGVWQVASEGRWCVAAANVSNTTVIDVWDFGETGDATQTMPWLAIRSQDSQSLEAWLSNPTPKHIQSPEHLRSVVTNLVLDVSHDRIVSASVDQCINTYSLSTGQLERKLEGHQGGIWSLALASSTGIDDESGYGSGVGEVDLVVSGSTDRTLRIWDMNDGRCLHVFGGHTGTVRALEVVNPEWFGGAAKELWPLTPLIVTGGRDHSLRVWALPYKGQPECRVSEEVLEDSSAEINMAKNPYHLHHLQGHTDAVRAIAARGRMAVSGSYDNTVRVWDIVSGELKHTLEGHTSKVYSVAYDPLRAQAYSGSMDSTVRIWSTTSGACLHTLAGHTSLVGLITLSPLYLVTGSADATVRVWDASSGALLHVLSDHPGAVTCLYHDETKVISGSDGTLRLWNIKDGSLARTLLEGMRGAWKVASDGRWCVSATNVSDDIVTMVDVWDFGETGSD